MKREQEHRINEEIDAPEVRVVGENVTPGVMSLQDALAKAEELGVDLVEIVPNATPPVCRLVDYQKFLYDQKKKQKEIRAKAAKISVKEIRFGPQTDEHDFNFKVNHARKFLQENNKVKAYVFFRGRSIMFKEQGELILLKFAVALEDVGKVEVMPSLEGRRLSMLLAPKKHK
ncbi:MAG: translation initiation factor IF-3 [Flavobacteriales bacterium]|nr:translation initiation factor IF-3 [Flavobacteriales bacterium]MCX7649703.1 translation initiation factor IF-3 [Flavobacteriales bacterium]MDW8431102.1 translation initiation factor IF-3 [Flavobacteriales bacterium]